MNSNELLDALKAHNGLASDYTLARQILKVDPMTVKAMRKRGLSDERALQIATLLNLDPAGTLAAVHAERAKDPGVKKVWETLAKSIKSAAAAVLIVLGMGITASEPLRASQDLPRYTLCAVRRLRRFWLALFGLIAFPVLLSGCGNGEIDNNHGYGYEYDQIGATGLRVRYAPGQTWPTLADLEAIYQQTEYCAAISAPGPLVIFVDSLPSPHVGWTYFDNGTILIVKDSFPAVLFWAFRHESVHYLLASSGDAVANTDHASPLFSACAP